MISRFKRASRRKKLLTSLAIALIAVAGLAAYAFANRVAVADVQSIAGGRVVVPASNVDIVRATWSIDPDTSLVTDVDLLVFPNAPVWKLKLFEFFVQVSCLDSSGAQFICSTGSTRVVFPSHWIGLRPLRILLNKPINPETTEIDDLSFIVTDLNPVPQGLPQLFAGALNPANNTAQVRLAPGQSTEIELIGHDVRLPDGRKALGAQTFFDVFFLPQGVTAEPSQGSFTLNEAGAAPHGRTMIMLTAASDAQIGETDAMIKMQTTLPDGTLSQDETTLEVDVVPVEQTSTVP